MDNYATKVSAMIREGVNDCAASIDPPLMEFGGELTLSDAKKKRLGWESQTDCKRTLRNLNNFNLLSYDKMFFTMKWQEGQHSKFPFASYMVTYFLPGIMFPKAYYWYEENDSPANTALFEAYKQNERWSFLFEKPYLNAVAESIEIPPFIEEFLISPWPYEVTMFERYILGYDRPICYATTSQVQTFDGLTFNHNLGSCWTVAVSDCIHGRGLINVKQDSGTFHAEIVWIVGGLKVNISPDQVMINDEVVSSKSNYYKSSLYEVHKVTQGYVVQINWVAAVRVTNVGIGIEVHPSFKGQLCGACSNYDGDSSTVTGPMGCSYSEYDLFMAAWTIPPGPEEGCDDGGVLAAKKEQVKSYQASCQKQFIYPTGQVLSTMQKTCFDYNYDIRNEGDYICTSTEPVSTCRPGCTTAIPYRSNLLYDCVLSDDPASKKQRINGLASWPRPGCHYFKKWWYTQSTGCEA
ncbi:unnamed protein product [Meganyctiphanes norvegica]|uniref:VWFD domain-containing protein n=1 Tax=Meganyctiphanes norvegica TaxID=48144 RepID=A0AAV2SGZ5_MEGNR